MCVLGVKIGLIAGRFIINLFIAKLTITKKMPKDGACTSLSECIVSIRMTQNHL